MATTESSLKGSGRIMDRKYRQRGYMEGERESEPRPEAERKPREFRTPNMPGFRTVTRCASCGTPLSEPIGLTSQCPKCAVDLHTCRQCASFDPGSRFECMQPIKTRIAVKTARNTCELFESRTVVERETSSAGPVDARQAFENLFKK